MGSVSCRGWALSTLLSCSLSCSLPGDCIVQLPETKTEFLGLETEDGS